LSHPGDIAAALAYQVKKEIAENYFGTRKAQEEEREDLLLQGKRLQKSWEEEVFPLLERIVQLLMEGNTGRTFGTLIEREDLFGTRNSSRIEQEAKTALLSCSPPFALTARGRYKKLIITIYQMAVERGDFLAQKNNALQKRVDLFNEELARFQSSFNLLEILSFVKTIENRDDLKGILGNNSHPGALPDLEEKMTIKPLDLSREGGDFLRALPPLSRIKKPLEQLIDLTYPVYCSKIKKK
jgi:hypothetical protein